MFEAGRSWGVRAAILGALLSAASLPAQIIVDEMVLELGGQQGPAPSLPDLDKVEFAVNDRASFEKGLGMVLVLAMRADDPDLRGLSPWLDGLQRAHAQRGLRVAVVSPRCEVPEWTRDPAWFLLTHGEDSGDSRGGNSKYVSLSKRGEETQESLPLDSGLDGWISTFAEKGLEEAHAALVRRVERLGEIEDHPTEQLVQYADRLIELNEGCPDGWILRFIVAVEREVDMAKAVQIVNDASRHMALDAPAMARFVEQALMTCANDKALLQALQMAITPAAYGHAEWLPIQLTHLRLLNQLGQKVPLKRLVEGLPEPADLDAREALGVAEALAFGACATDFAEEAQAYLEKARDASGSEYAHVRYNVVRYCLGDEKAAEEIAVALCRNSGSLNNTCWYAVTKHPLRGRFNGLAHSWAKRMLETESCSANEHDTAALAHFLGGDIAKAVELQEIAVRGGATANFQRRLDRFKKAAKAAGIEIE